MSKKKVILAVVPPVITTIVFAMADRVRKRYNLSFGRMTLIAVVVAGVAAAMMVISNFLARI